MGQRISATTLAPELRPEELSTLLEFVTDANRGDFFLEIGTAAGGTLCQMMKCFAEGERPRFVVVDPMSYFAGQLEIVQKNLLQHGLDAAQVDFRIGTSAEFFFPAKHARESYDFMFIDGSHKIRDVVRDLRWLQLLKVGGVVCFHDYHEKYKGVKLPVDRLQKKFPNYRREKLIGNLIVLRKTAPSAAPEITFYEPLWAMLLAPILQWETSLKKRLRRR